MMFCTDAGKHFVDLVVLYSCGQMFYHVDLHNVCASFLDFVIVVRFNIDVIM